MGNSVHGWGRLLDCWDGGMKKTRPKGFPLRRVHKPIMYPRYHSNCALRKGRPSQAPTSPMLLRGSHGRRLLIHKDVRTSSSEVSGPETSCCRASTAPGSLKAEPSRPSSSSLLLFTYSKSTSTLFACQEFFSTVLKFLRYACLMQSAVRGSCPPGADSLPGGGRAAAGMAYRRFFEVTRSRWRRPSGGSASSPRPPASCI